MGQAQGFAPTYCEDMNSSVAGFLNLKDTATLVDILWQLRVYLVNVCIIYELLISNNCLENKKCCQFGSGLYKFRLDVLNETLCK
jgi:hypothetical protein